MIFSVSKEGVRVDGLLFLIQDVWKVNEAWRALGRSCHSGDLVAAGKLGGPYPWARTSSSLVLEKEACSRTRCKKGDPYKRGLGVETVFNYLGSPTLLLRFLFHCLCDFDVHSRS